LKREILLICTPVGPGHGWAAEPFGVIAAISSTRATPGLQDRHEFKARFVFFSTVPMVLAWTTWHILGVRDGRPRCATRMHVRR